MEKYAPNKMELASRDVVSRAEQTEINEGRGFPDGTVALDITVVPRKRIHEALREIVNVGRDFAGVDITSEPIHIKPGNHYIDGRRQDRRGRPDRRSPASTPPASAPASRSTAATGSARTRCSTRSSSAAAPARTPPQRGARHARCPRLARRCSRTRSGASARSSAATAAAGACPSSRPSWAQTMDKYVRRVPRRGRACSTALEIVRRLKEEAKDVAIDDQGTVFNQDVLGALELQFMLDNAEAIVISRDRAQGEPRRPVPHRLPGAQRRGVAQAHQPHARRRASPRSPTREVTITQWQPRGDGSTEMADYTLKIRRYDPESGEPAYWAGLRRRPRRPSARVLDGILQVKDREDGSIGIRCSCQAAICGSCGVRINGQSRARLQHQASARPPRRARRRRDHRRADGQHARAQGPDRGHGRGALEEGPARRAVAAARGRPARARVHRAGRVDDRRDAVDGLHPLRRLRLGLPLDGGRPASSSARPRSPRPTASSATRATAQTEERLQRPRRGPARHLRLHPLLRCVEVCPKDVAPMNQIMRLRRRATHDFEINDRNNGYGHEQAFIEHHREVGHAGRGAAAAASSATARCQGPAAAARRRSS